LVILFYVMIFSFAKSTRVQFNSLRLPMQSSRSETMVTNFSQAFDIPLSSSIPEGVIWYDTRLPFIANRLNQTILFQPVMAPYRVPRTEINMKLFSHILMIIYPCLSCSDKLSRMSMDGSLYLPTAFRFIIINIPFASLRHKKSLKCCAERDIIWVVPQVHYRARGGECVSPGRPHYYMSAQPSSTNKCGIDHEDLSLYKQNPCYSGRAVTACVTTILSRKVCVYA
jgi:hypothetical protein